jgi:ribosomal protein S12 methylthiotransferase accessory factor
MHTALIPKQLISRQCQKLIVPQEGFMNEFTTSGAAGWFTQDGAVTRGLFELIQRDAFMVTWLTKQKIDEIEIESIKNELIIELLRKIKTAKADVCIYKLDSAAKVPTVLVVVYDKCFTKEQVYVTAHTDSTFELAILGAIQEVLPFFYERVQVSVPDNYEPFISRGVNRSLRINLCKSNEMLNCLRNLSSGRYVSINELEKANFKSNSEKSILEELVNKMSLLGEGYTPYFYEYTDKILNKLGFHVVKCFVPKLFPLYLSDHLATIASSRLNTLNERIHSDIISRLETHPHPFA